MVKNPVLTAWLRLFCAIFILFAVCMGSQPIRSSGINIGDAIMLGFSSPFKGPGFPLFIVHEYIGLTGAISFWSILIISALCGGHKKTRHLFYVLFGFFVIMTSLYIVLQIGRGAIAAAH